MAKAPTQSDASTQSDQKSEAEILELLRRSVSEFNKWREESDQLVDLSDANLSEANLSGANLSGADLGDADLSEANLSGANLSGADLGDADLLFADLKRANLSEADLGDADLGGADLGDADLRRANLSGADLRRANLSGANLTYAVTGETLTVDQLKTIRLGDENTTVERLAPLYDKLVSHLPKEFKKADVKQEIIAAIQRNNQAYAEQQAQASSAAPAATPSKEETPSAKKQAPKEEPHLNPQSSFGHMETLPTEENGAPHHMLLNVYVPPQPSSPPSKKR